jgi:outer membrane lipoprotein SlyB
MTRMRLLAIAVLTLLVTTGCVTHPVGPARSARSYEAKAASSAEAALSAVETVRMLAQAATDGKVFGTYASVTVDGQEDELTKTSTTFLSIQPPDDASRQLGDELGALLDSALAHVRAVRITIRRGELDRAAAVAAPLAGDAESLDEFAEAL